MAEYKLSYTAQEIDSKLGKISEIENSLYDKQDKLTFDLEPVEDGENPITSGGVYAALQGVSCDVESVNGKIGVVELTAEDIGALPDTTVIPTVPTNVSEFTNDVGYITSESLENKQDKLTFDAEPSEGSENLVTSGGVYTAIQNATPNLTYDEVPTEGSDNLVKSGAIHAALQNVGGGADLTAGDFIEIKDGVVRCTYGDVIGATEVYDEFFSAEDMQWSSYANGIVQSRHYADSIPSKGTGLKIAFTLPDETEPFYYTTEVIDYIPALGMTGGYAALCNVGVDGNGAPTILDSTVPTFLLELFEEDDGDCRIILYAFTTYTGASISISTIAYEPQYALLPSNALSFNFDAEPTEGSTNIVNSGGLYNVLGDIKAVITQINALVGGES